MVTPLLVLLLLTNRNNPSDDTGIRRRLSVHSGLSARILRQHVSDRDGMGYRLSIDGLPATLSGTICRVNA